MTAPKQKKLPKTELNAVAQLSSMNFFPTHSEGQKALIDAFATTCANKNRVTQGVQYFLDNFTNCPTVHEIKSYCFRNYFHLKDGVSRLRKLKETVECPKCADHPGRRYVIQVDGKWIDPPADMADTEGKFVLTLCDCEIGKELKRIQRTKEKRL